MIDMLDFKERMYFEKDGTIKDNRMCPILVEEGKCSKYTDICPDGSNRPGIKCVFASTYIINKYKVK